jgi:hypothetical protein
MVRSSIGVPGPARTPFFSVTRAFLRMVLRRQGQYSETETHFVEAANRAPSMTAHGTPGYSWSRPASVGVSKVAAPRAGAVPTYHGVIGREQSEIYHAVIGAGPLVVITA